MNIFDQVSKKINPDDIFNISLVNNNKRPATYFDNQIYLDDSEEKVLLQTLKITIINNNKLNYKKIGNYYLLYNKKEEENVKKLENVKIKKEFDLLIGKILGFICPMGLEEKKDNDNTYNYCFNYNGNKYCFYTEICQDEDKENLFKDRLVDFQKIGKIYNLNIELEKEKVMKSETIREIIRNGFNDPKKYYKNIDEIAKEIWNYGYIELDDEELNNILLINLILTSIECYTKIEDKLYDKLEGEEINIYNEIQKKQNYEMVNKFKNILKNHSLN